MKSYTSVMRLLTALILSLAIVALGCRKKPEATDSAPAPPPAPVSLADTTKEAPPPPPPGTTAPDAAPSESQGPREIPMDLDSLNSILSGYIVATDRVPKSFEEMVKLKLIPRVPTPPAGKKYVIDPVSQKIKVVNK